MDTLSYMQNDDDTLATPLPDQEEGQTVPEGDDERNLPEVSMPKPEEDGTVTEFDSSQIPVVPLPNPGEGGPLPDYNAGGPNQGIWGSIITVFPKPIIPCYFCSTTQYGVVRFLNAAAGYNPFIIYINNQMVVNGLDNAEVSQYGRVSSGSQTVTVAGQNGYVYIQKQITVPMNGVLTVAVINAPGGLDLMEITDVNCNGGANTGCFRVCNLSETNRSIDAALNGGAVAYQNVDYGEVTSFRYLPAGYYTVSVSNSAAFAGNPLLTSNLYIRGNVSYTLYVFNWNNSQDAVRILIVEDRRN